MFLKLTQLISFTFVIIGCIIIVSGNIFGNEIPNYINAFTFISIIVFIIIDFIRGHDN
jgi:hypothetical protein